MLGECIHTISHLIFLHIILGIKRLLLGVYILLWIVVQEYQCLVAFSLLYCILLHHLSFKLVIIGKSSLMHLMSYFQVDTISVDFIIKLFKLSGCNLIWKQKNL